MKGEFNMRVVSLVGIGLATGCFVFVSTSVMKAHSTVPIVDESIPLADRITKNGKFVGACKDVTVDGICYTLYPDGTAVLNKVEDPKLSSFDGSLYYDEGEYIIVSVALGAFGDHENLKEVTFTQGLKSIGFSAFANCTALEKVNFPSSLVEIESSAFLGCNHLKTISLPENIRKIEPWTFAYCAMLEKVELPDGCEELGEYAFTYCPKLDIDSMDLENVEMGECAFYPMQ